MRVQGDIGSFWVFLVEAQAFVCKVSSLLTVFSLIVVVFWFDKKIQAER